MAAHLLGSLPSVLHDEDEGIAEALLRLASEKKTPQRQSRRWKKKLGLKLERVVEGMAAANSTFAATCTPSNPIERFSSLPIF